MDFKGNLDFMGICLDEIALEGLDGITLPSLWKRLSKHGNFPLALDDSAKQFIWECMLQHRDLQLFLLEEARKPLVIYNRYSNVDIEMGIVLDADESAYDIYPHCPVQTDQVKGSCSSFNTRKDLTAELKVRSRNLPMMLAMYGSERVVVVASQEERNRALLGTEVQPNLELTLEQYCLLERIGRSRYHGEVTMGRLSLCQMKIPNKKMFYVSKLLLKCNLITKQAHLQRIGNGTQHSSLLHLRRFYVERLSTIQVMVMKMCNILKEKPDNREIFNVLRSELGMKEGSFKKMFNKTYQVCVQAKMIPYGEFYPDAPKEKRFALNGKERQLKIAVLVKNYDDPDEEEFEEEEEDKSQVRFSMDPRKMTFDRPILSQLYNVIEKAGPNGITSSALRTDLGISKLDVRLLLRNLERRHSIFSVMQDMGRQRSSCYIAQCFEEENLANSQLQEMKQKLLNYSQNQMLSEDFQNEELFQRPDYGEFNQLDNVVVEYLEDDQSDTLTKSWNFSLKDITTACRTGRDKESPNLTYKMLKRVNLVIDAVHEHKLIDDTFRIQKLISQAEQEEGLVEKIDKKSTHRIISRLSKDGYIRSIKTRLSMGNTVKKLHFICDSSIMPDDPLVQSAIEQAKLKYFTVNKQNVSKILYRSSLQELHENDLGSSTGHSKGSKVEVEYIPSIGRVYGLLPKFLRMKQFHTFLFYMVYDYEGSQTPIQIKDENSPAIYNLSETWKRFVPPLPQHSGKGQGWCLVSDIILSMPLSLLVKVVNYTYKIEGIEAYTEDPTKQHYLLRHLPHALRNLLLHSRRYIFAVHEVLTKLAFMGLLSFGPQQYKEKDQVFVYIHQKASIKDTSLSERGYMTITPDLSYVVTKYHMKTCDDVENYWYELENVCMRTPLGSSRNSSGLVKNIYHDPVMQEAARQKTCDEICDNGIPPGDGLGAAGLDSSLFAHLKRNWSWSTTAHLRRFPQKKEEEPLAGSCPVGISYMKYLAERDQEVLAVTDSTKTKRLSRLTGKNKLILPEPQVGEPLPDDKAEEESKIKTSVVPNIVVRKGYKRKCPTKSKQPPAKQAKKSEKRLKGKKKDKPRRPYYDEKDKIALNKMSKRRVCWSVQEDSFLLLCKVASCFLDPHQKGIVIPFSMIREIMHKRFPALSYNKTSRACQRRISFMMHNPATVANVSVFLLEAKQDGELVRQFQGPKPVKRDEEAWLQMFTTVLNHLLEKFTLSLKDRCTQLSLPSCSDEFLRRYKVSVTGDIKDKHHIHNEARNNVDIYCSVMFCFILCSMFTIGDKTNWSYTLYRVYQLYPDSLLRSVLARLKRDRLITRRKEINVQTEMTIPLSSLPHKLSVHFEMNLQTRYQPQIYERAAQLFNMLTADYSLSEPKGVNLYGHIEPGDAALMLSLNATENIVFNLQVPDQVVIFDSSMTDDMKTKIKEKVKQYEQEDAQELDDQDSKAEQSQRTADDTLEISSSRASRIALYMLRHELGTSLSDHPQHAQDYFLINSCELSCVLRLPEQKKWYPLSPFKAQCAMDSQKLFLPLEVIKPSEESILQTYRDHGYPDEIALDGVKLVTYILEKKESGCVFEEICNFELNGHFNISEHLKFLVSNQLLLRVGVTCFRYVSLFYSKPWILNSIKVAKDDKVLASEAASEQEKQMMREEKRAKRAKLMPSAQVDLALDEESPRINTAKSAEENNVSLKKNSKTSELTHEKSDSQEQRPAKRARIISASEGPCNDFPLNPSFEAQGSVPSVSVTPSSRATAETASDTAGTTNIESQNAINDFPEENSATMTKILPDTESLEQEVTVVSDSENLESQVTIVPDIENLELQVTIVPDIENLEQQVTIVPDIENLEQQVTIVHEIDNLEQQVTQTDEKSLVTNTVSIPLSEKSETNLEKEKDMQVEEVETQTEEILFSEQNQDETFKLEVENLLDTLKSISSKMSNWGSSCVKPVEVVVNAEHLFTFGNFIIQICSGENIAKLISNHQEQLPGEFLEMFSSTNINCEVLKQCLQGQTLDGLVQQLSTSQFIRNGSCFLSGLEESTTVLNAMNLFSTVFCSCPDAVTTCDSDLIVILSDLLNSVFSRGVDMLLKSFKFKNVLQCYTNLVETIINLKKAAAENEAILKDWLEEIILTPVEANINLKTTVENTVQICVHDLLWKVEQPEITGTAHLNDWFLNTVIPKLENEELRDWLLNIVFGKLESILEVDSLKEWLTQNVINQVENSFSENYNFLGKWLNETVLCKVCEQQEASDVCDWIQEVIEEVAVSEECYTKERSELSAWMSNVILKKVDEISRGDTEHEALKDWFMEKLISVLDSSRPSEVPDKQCILHILYDAIEEVENKEKKIINDVTEKLNDVVDEVAIVAETNKDVEKWFYQNLMGRIHECCFETEEIQQWLEENLLQVLEKTCKSDLVIEEVKLLLHNKIDELIGIHEPKTPSSEVISWFEHNVLNILVDYDKECSENADVKQLVNTMVQCVSNRLDHDQLIQDVSACVDQQILGIVETTCTILEMSEEKHDISMEVDNEVQEITSDVLHNNILGVVDVASDILDNLPGANQIMEMCVPVENQFSEEQVLKDTSQVSQCLNNSVLDVIETTSSLLGEVHECNSESMDITSNVSQQKLATQSVLDAVNKMSEFVHSVNSLIEVIDEEPMDTSVENVGIDYGTDSSVLNKDFLDEIDHTFDLVNYASKQEFLQNVDQNKTDSDKQANNICLGNTLEANSDDEMVRTCLQNSVLDVIDTTSSVTDTVSMETVIKSGSESGPDSGLDTCVNNIVNIVDLTTDLVNTVQNQASSDTRHDSLITAVGASEVITEEEVSSSVVDTSVNILDVVAATTNLIDSVHEMTVDENQILQLCSSDVAESLTDLVSTEVIPEEDVSSSVVDTSVVNILDVVATTTDLIDSVQEINIDENQILQLGSSHVAESSTDLVSNMGNECKNTDVDQEGKGKRKRKRTVPFETKSANRMSNYEQVHFVSRPWRKPDGYLNRKTLEKYLIALLGYIMTVPGVTQTQLYERFELSMQPVFVLELLEILSECECVSTQYLRQSHASGLFSQAITYQLLDSWEPDCQIVYEGTVDAILKLTYFLSGFLHYHH